MNKSESLTWASFNAALYLGGIPLLIRSKNRLNLLISTLANRFHVPRSVILLLTTGTRWDVLATLSAALHYSNTPLATGLVIGSIIANTLVPFPLYLIAYTSTATPVIKFNHGLKLSASVVMATAPFFVVFIEAAGLLGKAGGVLSLVLYACCVTAVIKQDWLSGVGEREYELVALGILEAKEGVQRERRGWLKDEDTFGDRESGSRLELGTKLMDLLLGRQAIDLKGSVGTILLQLLGASILLAVAGSAIAFSTARIGDSLSVPPFVLGTTFLSLTITAPEHILSVTSEHRKTPNALALNVAGGNFFLVNFCAGILLIFGSSAIIDLKDIWATIFEVLVIQVGNVFAFIVLAAGGRRWMGWVLGGSYAAFLFVEGTWVRSREKM